MTKSATREAADEVSAPIASPSFTGKVGIGSSSPVRQLEIKDDGTLGQAIVGIIADAGDAAGIFMGTTSNNNAGGVRYFTDTNKLTLRANDEDRLLIDSAGIVTKPLQPAFSASAVETNNPAVNTWHTVNLTEIFDNNADFNPSTDAFTAPVGGKYQLNGSIRVDNLQEASGYMYIKINTSNRGYYSIVSPPAFDSTPQYWGLTISHLADMDAGDTATLTFYISGGTAGADIHSESMFSGFLAC